MEQNSRKTIFTTIGIDSLTNKLIEKLCKRYSLKKGEIVKLAFQYLDKAQINPKEAPESVKAELSKINKRQDDIIRFIRHYEEQQLNPMIRTSHSIAQRFEGITDELKTLVQSTQEKAQDKHSNLLNKLNEVLTSHAKAINSQGKQLNTLTQTQQRDNVKLLTLISLYTELSACSMMETKKKETLRKEIQNLINSQ